MHLRLTLDCYNARLYTTSDTPLLILHTEIL